MQRLLTAKLIKENKESVASNTGYLEIYSQRKVMKMNDDYGIYDSTSQSLWKIEFKNQIFYVQDIF